MFIMFKKIFNILIILSVIKIQAQIPNYHSEELEVVADLGEYQAIGLSVSSDNRIFVSFPKRGEPYKNGLVEIIDGKQIPFPNKEWNHNKTGKKSFFSIQDLYVDKDDFLWVLDSKPKENHLYPHKDPEC